ncbi:hypothetical protein GGI11_006745, partial [Coemansia sp. RSA 2049]
DSGESYWCFGGDYWADREAAASGVKANMAAAAAGGKGDNSKGGKAAASGGKHTESIGHWEGVDDIF